MIFTTLLFTLSLLDQQTRVAFVLDSLIKLEQSRDHSHFHALHIDDIVDVGGVLKWCSLLRNLFWVEMESPPSEVR